MKKHYVNIRQEMIFAKTVWAENKEHAIFKVSQEASKKGVGNWNKGRAQIFCEKEKKQI